MTTLIQGMHMKVLVRYIGTGCIFFARRVVCDQGQVFNPQRHPPPVQMKVECPLPPPPPGGGGTNSLRLPEGTAYGRPASMSTHARTEHSRGFGRLVHELCKSLCSDPTRLARRRRLVGCPLSDKLRH